MRDLALSSIFAVLVAMTVRHTWIGAMTWTWFSLMNPHKLTYGFAFSLPFAAIIAAVTLLSVLWNTKVLRLPPDPSVVMLVLFLGWVTLATAFAIHPALSFIDLEKTFKIQLMTLVCLAVLRSRKLIEMFIWVNVVSIGFYGVKGGIFAIATGGASRVWGPTEGMIQDNNSIGLALVMTIPLMNYLRVVSTQRWIRLGLAASILLCAVAVLATQSRGAFLAISAMGLVLWFRSQKKLLGAVVTVVVAASLLSFMPDTWEQRMSTISTYKSDGSALGRINAWETAIRVANERVTGAGFAIEEPDIFAKYAPDPTSVLTAHSIYFQALGEQGWIGLGMFLSLGALSFWNAARLRKVALAKPETAWLHDLSGMIQVSMVGYAVGGAFLSLTYFDLPYNVLVVLVASKYWLIEERWKTETTGLFNSGSGRAPVEVPASPVVARR